MRVLARPNVSNGSVAVRTVEGVTTRSPAQACRSSRCRPSAARSVQQAPTPTAGLAARSARGRYAAVDVRLRERLPSASTSMRTGERPRPERSGRCGRERYGKARAREGRRWRRFCPCPRLRCVARRGSWSRRRDGVGSVTRAQSLPATPRQHAWRSEYLAVARSSTAPVPNRPASPSDCSRFTVSPLANTLLSMSFVSRAHECEQGRSARQHWLRRRP